VRGNNIKDGNVGIGTTTPASTLTITGNFSATGTKSAVVNTSYGIRKLYAMESPDVRFYDEGRAKLNNGIANISLDPIFIETVEPDYQVYLTAEAKTQGIYVDEKAREYFIVKGYNPTSNIPFSWLISAVRKGYSATRMELENKGDESKFIATIDEASKITDIEVKGNNEIAKSILKNSDKNNKIENTNLENKFQVAASTESEIINSIQQKTNLNLEQIKKSITFRRKAVAPSSAEEESAAPTQNINYMSKVNGSIILKLG